MLADIYSVYQRKSYPPANMILIQLLAAEAVENVMAGTNLTDILQTTWRNNPVLTRQQRGAIQDLTYGVLRQYAQLAAVLDALLNKPLQDDHLRYLLLVSLYQLGNSKTASHTIVNFAVSAARQLTGHSGIAGLVNAVLRNFIRQRVLLLEQTTQTEATRFSYSHWWIDALRRQYPQQYQDILLAGNQHPPMTVRINQRQTSLCGYLAMLTKHGVDAEVLWDNALKIKQPVAVEKLPGFADGLVSVQDAGAQLAAPLLAISDGMRVLDACAAPGGKSTHLLELADIELTILDNNAARLRRVTENLARLKLSARKMICGDACHPKQWWDGQLFDRIMVDAPCSASGVVSRHPDIKWRRQPGDIARFAQTQLTILEGMWPLLKPGARLLYITCSIFQEENDWLVKKFLLNHPEAKPLPVTHPQLNSRQLLPNDRHDGFFYALLQKN